MRLATFNINSIRARLDTALGWMRERQPDLVLLQETKVTDAEFPSEEFMRAGYGVATSGQKSYNGVAILSRLPLSDVSVGLLGDCPSDDRRYISASAGGLRCASVYVPNGKEVGHPAFFGKLAWLARLRETLDRETSQHGLPMVIGGDFNVALEEQDVWSAEAMEGRIHFHPDERTAMRRVLGDQLMDAFRAKHPTRKEFSWWDYRGPCLRLNRGLRIDYLFVSSSLVDLIADVRIEAEVRHGTRPSDHAPVMLDLNL